MKTRFLDQSLVYDGSQLRSLFAYMHVGVEGDSTVAWRGGCQIPFANMVDGEDRRAGATIAGDDMVHFIIEKFDCSLLAAVALQRLFTNVVREALIALGSLPAATLRRDGDDLFLRDKKLSISIATVSPLSALIHFAVNARNAGTPVPTASLIEDLGVEPAAFVTEVLRRWSEEVGSLLSATRKVNWVP